MSSLRLELDDLSSLDRTSTHDACKSRILEKEPKNTDSSVDVHGRHTASMSSARVRTSVYPRLTGMNNRSELVDIAQEFIYSILVLKPMPDLFARGAPGEERGVKRRSEEHTV